MEWLQELFVTAILAVVICFAVAIFMTDTEEKTDHNKVVEEAKKKKKKSGKSKKRVKFADDVMVKNIDHFEVAEEPIIKDFKLSHVKLSEKVELLDNFSEGDHKFGSEGVVVKTESEEVLLCSEESVKECDDVNLLMEVVKGDGDEQNAGLLLDKKEVGGEKTVLADCLNALDVGEIDCVAAMESVKNGDIVTDQKARIRETRLLGEALAGETMESNIQSAEVLDKSSEDLVLDGQNEVEMAHGGDDEVETVEEEGLGKMNIGDDEDDDWEGVESSELEKVFAEAVNFVEYGGRGKDDQMANLGNDVQMQLYGLHRVALDGPCHEPQPMALKISARAKWNAWQRLGSMSPEVAMEQYIKLLSDTDPGWMQDFSVDDGKQEFIGSKSTGSPDTEKALLEDVQGDAGDERTLELEQKTLTDGGPLSSVAKSTKENTMNGLNSL